MQELAAREKCANECAETVEGMGRKCSICVHPKRADIEADLLSSVPFRAIAAKYSVGRAPVQRHFDNSHIAQETAKAKEWRRIALSKDLFEKIEYYEHEALKILFEAKEPQEGKPLLAVALSAIGRAAALLEIRAKLGGQIRDLEVNILINPIWLDLKAQIFASLEHFPEARRAMLGAIEQGDLSEVQRGMIKPDAGEKVSPEILQIINAEFEGDHQPDETGPDLRPVEVYEKAEETQPPAESPQLQLGIRFTRVRYRCIKAHHFHGKMWAPGQVWDSEVADAGPEPPAGDDENWAVINPAARIGLQPTRRV